MENNIKPNIKKSQRKQKENRKKTEGNSKKKLKITLKN